MYRILLPILFVLFNMLKYHLKKIITLLFLSLITLVISFSTSCSSTKIKTSIDFRVTSAATQYEWSSIEQKSFGSVDAVVYNVYGYLFSINKFGFVFDIINKSKFFKLLKNDSYTFSQLINEKAIKNLRLSVDASLEINYSSNIYNVADFDFDNPPTTLNPTKIIPSFHHVELPLQDTNIYQYALQYDQKENIKYDDVFSYTDNNEQHKCSSSFIGSQFNLHLQENFVNPLIHSFALATEEIAIPNKIGLKAICQSFFQIDFFTNFFAGYIITEDTNVTSNQFSIWRHLTSGSKITTLNFPISVGTESNFMRIKK